MTILGLNKTGWVIFSVLAVLGLVNSIGFVSSDFGLAGALLGVTFVSWFIAVLVSERLASDDESGGTEKYRERIREQNDRGQQG